MNRVHELSFDKVVVGGSLSALKYAFDEQLPIIIYIAKPPHRFSEEFIVGDFGRYCFSLSMAGLLPF